MEAAAGAAHQGPGAAARRQTPLGPALQPSSCPGSGGSSSGNVLPDTPAAVPTWAEQSVLSPTPSPAARPVAPPCALNPQQDTAAAAVATPAQAACGATHAAGDPAARARGQLAGLVRLHSFVRCVSGSPLLQSALLALQVAAAHPSVAGGAAAPAGLEWTLAQMLVLFRRTGDETATEGTLLAALWLLEAAHDCRRSTATGALSRYVRLIAAFCPEAARRLRADWPAAFHSLRQRLVGCQAALLDRLGWRVHIDYDTDAAPCYQLLFGAPPVATAAAAAQQPPASASGSAAGPAPADVAARLASTRALLSGSMRSLVEALRQQGSLYRGRLQLDGASDEDVDSGGAPESGRPAKRQRTAY